MTGKCRIRTCSDLRDATDEEIKTAIREFRREPAWPGIFGKAEAKAWTDERGHEHVTLSDEQGSYDLDLTLAKRAGLIEP